MMRTRFLVPVLAVSVAACGAGSTGATVPPDPDQVLLTVTSEGGFVPVEFNLDRAPQYQLMADGTLYFFGPIPEIYPGPLLPNIQVATVGDSVMDDVHALVEDLGLADVDERIDSSGADMIADATTVFITYFDDNGAHRLGVYALGMTEVERTTDRLLATEMMEILDEAALDGDSTAYVPDRLQVAAGPGAAEPGLSTVEPWPLDVAVADMPDWGAGWTCTTVEGDAVPPLLDVLGAANSATMWDTGSGEVSIRARGLLPGETGCGGGPQG